MSGVLESNTNPKMAAKTDETSPESITEHQSEAPQEEKKEKQVHYAYGSFHPRKQLRRILAVSLARWLLTAALIASIYAILWNYSQVSVMSTRTKSIFNALIIGFSIGLGLNIASSLKAMAREVRWWILSLGEYPVREADVILQSENLSHVAHLALASSSYVVRLYALTWLLINVASQIAVALLGLTYSTNAADWIAITRPGNVNIPNMSTVATGRVISSDTQFLGALRYTANNYGTVALAWNWATLKDIPTPGTIWDSDDPLVYCSPGACRYVFLESTTQEQKFNLTVTTNRSVETTGDCSSWRVISGGNGTQSTIVITDGIRTDEVKLPAVNGADETTFMVDVASEQAATWSIITAFEASESNSWYYRCNISIGPVVNATHDVHKLGVNVTSLATSAIALQGYGASTLAQTNDTFQFQSYPAESSYGKPQNGSTEGIGTLISGFTTGVVGVTAQVNEYIVALGLQPQKGVTVAISNWKYVHLILGLTLVLQLLLALVMGLLANRVPMRGESHLATSMLLRPVLQQVGDNGLVANGKEIAAMFGPRATLTYTPFKDGVYHIRLRS
ncbi:hypothetical protein G7046_g9268 [Stylonectria norvegica]|nr:hypothetical protein G7046_g9268 [Stylonectria norvegica]